MDFNSYYDKRLDKLEDSHDKLHDKVDEIKEEMMETKSELKLFNQQVESHVSSDQRIAAQIAPLVALTPKLSEMVEEHNFNKTKRIKRIRKAKTIALYLGIIGTLVGIAVGIAKLI